MKIILQGGKIEIPTEKKGINNPVVDVMQQVAEGLKQKLNNSDYLQENIETVFVSRVEYDFMFKVKGCEDLQQITVQHHEQPELLTVIVDIDDDGNIKSIADNDEKSLYSEEMIAIMNGDICKDFQEINTTINFDDVDLYGTIVIGNFELKVFQCKSDSNVVWDQYFQNGKLIQEVQVTLEDNQTIDDLVNYYKSMIA